MLINKFDKKTETYSVLDVNGEIIAHNYQVSLSNEQITKAFYFMKLSKRLDEKMIQMQRQGRMLTFPPNLGEEALQVATALGMDKNDYYVPAFRSGAVALTMGVPIWQLMLLWNGNEWGNHSPEGINFLPPNITIGAQYSHATGIGFALNYQNKANVAVTVIGDGGTSEGEFYEAMNFGAVRNAQTIYCVNNNLWAISTPTDKETVQLDIASKAIAAGMAYIKVDGNDLFASYDAFVEARKYVLDNKQPILVEFVTYRRGPHTTSDNPRVYRTEEYENEHNKKCPIARLEKYILANKIISDDQINEMDQKIDSEINEAIKVMESKKISTIDDVFDYTYANNYADLKNQKEEAKKIFGGGK